MDRASLEKLRVVDLKELLRERSLGLNGVKKDLIDRLLEHEAAQSTSAAEPEPMAVDVPAPAAEIDESAPAASKVLSCSHVT